jgi:hypothetical protein
VGYRTPKPIISRGRPRGIEPEEIKNYGEW